MSVYAFSNILLMERTAQITASVGATAGDAVSIPTITVSGRTFRPTGFAIAEASADVSLKLGTASDLGDATTIVAADLGPTNQFAALLGENDIIVISDGAGAATVNIRWFWNNQARDGVGVGNAYGSLIPLKTEAFDAVAAEAPLTIPTGAVELLIFSLSTDGLKYRVDDGTANGQQLTIDAADVSYANPYSVFVNDGDRLRVQRTTSDVTVHAYWRISR